MLDVCLSQIHRSWFCKDVRVMCLPEFGLQGGVVQWRKMEKWHFHIRNACVKGCGGKIGRKVGRRVMVVAEIGNPSLSSLNREARNAYRQTMCVLPFFRALIQAVSTQFARGASLISHGKDIRMSWLCSCSCIHVQQVCMATPQLVCMHVVQLLCMHAVPQVYALDVRVEAPATGASLT